MSLGLEPSFLEGKWADYKQEGTELLKKPENLDHLYSVIVAEDVN